MFVYANIDCVIIKNNKTYFVFALYLWSAYVVECFKRYCFYEHFQCIPSFITQKKRIAHGEQCACFDSFLF